MAMAERYVPGADFSSIGMFTDAHHRARYAWASKVLDSVGGAFLDIACGEGYGTATFARPDRTVVGVDVSKDAVERAQQRYGRDGLAFRVGDGENLSWLGDGCIDAAVTFETIEHLHHPTAFLSELARVLRPGGVLLLSTPNRLLASTKYPITGRPNNPFHVFEYRKKALLDDLSKHFKVEEFLGQTFVPRPLAFWPVQVGIKSACSAFKKFGAYAIVNRIFHSQDDVEVRAGSKLAEPSIYVARCKPR